MEPQHIPTNQISHEEADTLIPMHVLDASKPDGDIRDIDVYSPDTYDDGLVFY